uniref:Peptidase A1 domain-containing protein n=1 Tax=Loa loa TaxID=7209 RepID=A0A1I7VW79_LOALO
MRLTIILCILLTTPIFAMYRIELHPVYSKSNHHAGYAAKVIIGDPEKEFRVILDTVTPLIWVAGASCSIWPSNCHNKQLYPSSCSRFKGTLSHNYNPKRSACLNAYEDNILINSLDGGRVNFSNSLFGTPSYLNWPEWENYQEIDGVFGLSALHVNSLIKGLTYAPLFLKMDINPLKKAIRENELAPVISIILPALDSNKTAMLTLGGRDDKLCDLDNERNESLTASRNRYNFKFLSIKMNNTKFSDKTVTMFAYPNVINPYISVPNEFMGKIVKDLKAQVVFTHNFVDFTFDLIH